MKKIFLPFLLALVAIALMKPVGTRAHGVSSVVDSTVETAPAIRSGIDAWLSSHAPVDVPFYVITYVHDDFVSLAAFALPADRWYVDNAVWVGSVSVKNGGVTLITPPIEKTPKLLAMPALTGGGSANVLFPWEGGKKMMYGESGIHAAGGSGSYATGFDAVDFLGGTDLGSGVASNKVYAAYAGEVDYVCEDGTTTLIRTTDASTGYRFIYAHMLDNANLVEGFGFTRAQLIGTLKSGSFDDTCGWAEQTDKHYHLHFGFEMASNAFRLEGCTLNSSTEDWTCGSTAVSPGEYLMKSSSNGGGGISVTDPSFWDLVLTGMMQFWDATIVANLPNHTTMEYTYVLYNAVILTLKIAWVMVYSNVNLGHLAAVLLISIAFRAVMGVAEFIMFLFKTYNTIFPKIPGM